MIDYSQRAIIVLASYDFEVLQLTLKSLDHTISHLERVIVILNSDRNNLYGSKTEVIARNWALKNPEKRKVVRPICSGGRAYRAIREVLNNYSFLNETEYICKMDDDIIPLKPGWLDRLAQLYYRKMIANGRISFTTGLINNNNWGFAQMIDVFDKNDEYKEIMNIRSFNHITRQEIAAGQVDNKQCGSVWSHPYLARWIHSWTSFCPQQFIKKTKDLDDIEIPKKVHYSIGCVFLKKELWIDMISDQDENNLNADDELLLHKFSIDNQLSKWAAMSEPIIHLFYYTQRVANKDILPQIARHLSIHFNDKSFVDEVEWKTMEDRIIQIEEEQRKIRM